MILDCMQEYNCPMGVLVGRCFFGVDGGEGCITEENNSGMLYLSTFPFFFCLCSFYIFFFFHLTFYVFNGLRRHLYVMGLINIPTCRKCGTEEET
jgi:hypothetical protein